LLTSHVLLLFRSGLCRYLQSTDAGLLGFGEGEDGEEDIEVEDEDEDEEEEGGKADKKAEKSKKDKKQQQKEKAQEVSPSAEIRRTCLVARGAMGGTGCMWGKLMWAVLSEVQQQQGVSSISSRRVGASVTAGMAVGR
jgi:hypothetical protein